MEVAHRKYNLRLHAWKLKLKSLMGWLCYFLGLKRIYGKDELVVLAIHNTPRAKIKNLERAIKYLRKSFEIIQPNDLDAFYKSELNGNKPKLLFTFDDGILSNSFAVELLDKLGIKACFFLVPSFIDSSDQEKYLKEKIYPNFNNDNFPDAEDRKTFSWDSIKDLSKKGHKIGCHSATHLLRSNSSPEQVEYEILTSAKMIRKAVPELSEIDSFCAPVDTTMSMNEYSMKLVKNRYSYFFTTFTGANKNTDSPLLIKRINYEIYWPYGTLHFILSPYVDNKLSEAYEQFKLYIK